eukprot:2902659-Lingulodinium_polyedra.AAC.1
MRTATSADTGPGPMQRDAKTTPRPNSPGFDPSLINAGGLGLGATFMPQGQQWWRFRPYSGQICAGQATA